MKLAIGKTGYFVEIDDADANLISTHAWTLLRVKDTQYAISSPRTGSMPILMHRLIMGLTSADVLEVDHRDRNGLNNKRDNLRSCSHAQNCSNRKKGSNNTSGFKGVYRHSFYKKKWYAEVQCLGKKYKSKKFDSPEEAHKAYCSLAVKLHGEFARFE